MERPYFVTRLRAWILTLLGCLSVLLCMGSAGAATWSNPTGGSWSNPANWTPPNVPDVAGETALLPDLGAAYQVTLDVDPAIDALQIDDGAGLDANGRSVAAIGSITIGGTLANLTGAFDSFRIHLQAGGVVTVAPGDSIVAQAEQVWNDGTLVVGPGATLRVGAVTRIDGSGTIELNQGRITGPDRNTLTVGSHQTLRGAGEVRAWKLDNYGLVEGNSTVPPLDFHLVYNFGTLRLSEGGAINTGGLVKNFDGVIIGDGTLWATHTIDNLNGGRFVADGGDLIVHALQFIEGQFDRTGGAGAVRLLNGVIQDMEVLPGAELAIDGFCDLLACRTRLLNHGTIRLSGSLLIGCPPDSVFLGGSGELILEGGGIDSHSGNGVLVHEAGHTLRGCGTLGAKIVNHGTIVSDCGGGGLVMSGSDKVNRNVIRVEGGMLKITGGAHLHNAGASLTMNGGTLWMDEGATLHNAGGTFANHGGTAWLGWQTSCSIVGGRIDGSGNALFRNRKLTTLDNVTLGPDVTFVTLTGATTTATGAQFTNQGTNRIVGEGRFVVAPSTDYLQTAGATVLEGGTLAATRAIQIAGALRGQGTVEGEVVNAGVLTPDAARTLTILGSYRQLPQGRIGIGLTGLAPGQFSRLDVSGDAELDGTLEVATVEPFQPGAEPALLDLVSCGSLSGQFAECLGMGVAILPVYGASGFSVHVNPGVLGVDERVLPKVVRFHARTGAAAGFGLELPRAAEVRIRAYDVSGREVATLAARRLDPGAHHFALGGTLPSGVYFARAELQIDGTSEVRAARVVLTR